MKHLIDQLKPLEFETAFASNEQCLEFLAAEKWKDGFVCRKCGNTNYCKGKTPFSCRCTRCKHDESATAHTIFHRCKIELTEAFAIAYHVCSNPDISSYELARRLEKRQMTCWKFKKVITDCISRNGSLQFVPPVE